MVDCYKSLVQIYVKVIIRQNLRYTEFSLVVGKGVNFLSQFQAFNLLFLYTPASCSHRGLQ